MAARTWTPEQRRQQARAIQRWKPWKQATGPKSVEGKAKVSGNAYAGGEWQELRQAIKTLNKALREQKDLIR